MKLFNSLTHTQQEVVPINNKSIGIYSCGPTVYSHLHIGNLSSFIYADTLRRVLRASGYTVNHVMNITDVDDKTIRDSKEQFPNDDPLSALQKLTSKYSEIFLHDIGKVGVDTSQIHFISAVDSISDMIQLIQRIADAGFAYAAEDGIYFSISAYTKSGHTYGRLQRVNALTALSRMANDEYDKDNASDFALWKAAVSGEPSWYAKFTVDGQTVTMPGRPGWHIECSAMSQTLGTPFDIHTGGIDLKFPHHENEIAQSIAAGATELANIFMHNNHILVDGRKMSKSLGNIITLRDLESRDFDPLAFRLLVLESHYQSESNFSWDIIEAASNRLHKWRAWADMRYQVHKMSDIGVSSVAIDGYAHKTLQAANDNLGLPGGVALIHECLEAVGQSGLTAESAPSFRAFIELVDNICGINLGLSEDISDATKQLLTKRQQARDAKDWSAADELRSEIDKVGIKVLDNPKLGQIWQRN